MTVPACHVAAVERRSKESCRLVVRRISARAVRSAPDDLYWSVEGLEQGSLDVTGFGDREHLRVVERLSAYVAKRDASSRVSCGRLQHLEKEGLREMKAAARRE